MTARAACFGGSSQRSSCNRSRLAFAAAAPTRRCTESRHQPCWSPLLSIREHKHDGRCTSVRAAKYSAPPSSGLSGGDAVDLPIFPLGMVAMPTAEVPLQIFEARYRVLFNTLLAGDTGVSEDLVQEESAFKSSRRFGLCYASRDGLATCGTVLKIETHEVFDDGRMYVMCVGCERFQIEEIVQDKPVLLARVKIVPEEDEDEASLAELAQPLREKFRQLMQLNAKHKRVDVSDELLHPKQLDEVPPSKLPFWLASMFAESVQAQQHILEMGTARERLTYVSNTLDDTIKYLSATLALESAFQSSPTGPEEVPRSENRQKGPD